MCACETLFIERAVFSWFYLFVFVVLFFVLGLLEALFCVFSREETMLDHVKFEFVTLCCVCENFFCFV